MNASASTVPSQPFPRLRVALDARSNRGWFLLAHLWLPLTVTLLLTIVLKAGHGDQAWADRLFEWEGHRWALKTNDFIELVLHRFGREFSAVAWLALLVGWLVGWLPGGTGTGRRAGRARWRNPMTVLLVSTLLASVLVAWLRSWSNMDCPWDLMRYGGARAYVGLFDLRPVGMPRGVCFPAGHASAGYAWLALYFFFLAKWPGWRWLGLGIGLGAGAVFGLAQQLRGAHFASHDLWTAAICWFTALAVYLLLRDHDHDPDREAEFAVAQARRVDRLQVRADAR